MLEKVCSHNAIPLFDLGLHGFLIIYTCIATKRLRLEAVFTVGRIGAEWLSSFQNIS